MLTGGFPLTANDHRFDTHQEVKTSIRINFSAHNIIGALLTMINAAAVSTELIKGAGGYVKVFNL